MIGYVLYPQRFAGTLRDLRDRLDYLQELHVSYLHVMLLLKPRPGKNDGGYAIMDHRAVAPELGTLEDVRDLATALRERGISLCVDLVLNHTAREHRWAQQALAGDPDHLAYYHSFDSRELPDACEQCLPEIFPDEALGNVTFVPGLGPDGGWVWTTFYDYQWDLNYANPAVIFKAGVRWRTQPAHQPKSVHRLQRRPPRRAPEPASDWDLVAQPEPEPEFEFDQRIAW